METTRPWHKVLDWLQSDRRRPVGAGIAAVVLAGALTGGILLASQGGDNGPGPALPTPTPFVSECNVPTLIDALSASTGDDWSRVQPAPRNGCFSMTASSSDAAGVAADTAFFLDSTEPQDADDIATRIIVEPSLAISVEEMSGPEAGETAAQPSYRYRVQPEVPLLAGEVYAFTLLDKPAGQPIRSWAFQTHEELRVVQTLPVNESTGVPINVGIELTFSHAGVEGIEQRFEIEPATEGRFETHKRVVVFVPEALLPATLYTVTLTSGAAVPGSGLTIDQDFQFQFETGNSDRSGDAAGPPPLQFSRRTWESSTTDPPAVAVFGSGVTRAQTVPFTVYRFDALDPFLAALDQFTAVPSWAYGSRARTTIDTSGLQVAATFDASVKSGGENADHYVIFPEALPQGLYLVETEFEGGRPQTLLQVTDVSAYASVSRTHTLVWANDLSTKAPIPGAVVTSTGPVISETAGADGIALFETPPDVLVLKPSYFGYTTTETVDNLVVTAPDGRFSVVPLADIFSGYQYYGFREYSYQGDPSLYWRFLYADRHLYHPTDTARFWGVAREREDPLASQDVLVELTGTSYSGDGSYEPIDIASVTVATNPTGTFIGELPFEGVSPGFYSLQASIDGQVITSTYVEVRDFVKPAYQIEIIPERNALYAGDSMEVLIRATFFDGTPVVGAALTYRTDKGEQPLTTDARGEATVRFEGSTVNGIIYGYTTVGLSAFPATPEEGEITGSAWVQVFAADITVDATTKYGDGQGVVSGTVYNVDLSRLNGGSVDDFQDFRGTPAAGRTVSFSVSEISYNKIETGEVYDFIQKIVRKTYRYDRVTTSIGNFQGISDGAGNFQVAFPAGPDKSYSIALDALDSAGRNYHNDLYLYSGKDYFSAWPNLTTDPLGTQGPYAIGDEVAVVMTQGDEPYPTGGDNRYLFYHAQNGIRSYSIEAEPRHAFAFAAGDIPSVSLRAVRFTGSTYVEAQSGFTATYDSTERALNVTVTPRQPQYNPGDAAILDVTVTDAAGQPVSAHVLLSAVDEALFRMQGEVYFFSLNILDSLYAAVSSGIYNSYSSHQSPLPSSGAEKGGDGNGGRDDFRDVALFEEVVTDASGHASVDFHLPDNLTSWRVNALAVTDDLFAGGTVVSVPVTLPIFADIAMNTSYLTTDAPVFRVRAFGDALSEGDAVSIEVTSPTLFADTLSATGQAFEGVDIPLPPLVEGHHEIHVRVSAAGNEDEIVRTIDVVPSRLLRDEVQYFELNAGQSFEPASPGDRTATVVISDHNRGRYYPVLGSLVWTYGDRLDQMLARNMAQGMILDYFGEESYFPAEFRPEAYQTAEGGLAILPFSDNDVTLSARVAALAPDTIGRQALAQYLRGVVDDEGETRERAIIALYGLAALDEPVLLDVQQLSSVADLTTREKLYLALAAAELGDDDTAGAVYGQLLAELGERRGGAVRLNVGSDQDDILEATSLAAVLAAVLGDDYAPLLFEYTTQNYTRDTLIQLEQVSYLAEALPRLSDAPVTFSYTADGEVHEAELDRGQSVALQLNGDELAALDLQVTQGTAGVSTSWLATFDTSSVDTDPAVSISRSYEGQSGDSVTLHQGDLARITLTWDLTPDAVEGCYQVSDLLPSGLRPVTRLYERNLTGVDVWYPYFVEGQRVSFCVSFGATRKTIVYYARVISTGTYTAEPAIMQAQQAQESLGLTGPLTVEID